MESLDEVLRRFAQRSSSEPTGNNSERAGTAEEQPDAECELCGGLRWIPVEAPVGAEGFGTFRPCPCQERVWGARQDDRLRRYSNLGPLARYTFARLEPGGRKEHADPAAFRRAVEAARAYAADPAGWLVLLGPSGTGKTHLAAAVANQVLDSGRPVLFVPAPELLDHLRAAFDPAAAVRYDDLFERVADAPLLVLDDLGAHSASPWADDKLDQILTRRYHARMPTVVTCGAPEETLSDRFLTRLLDPALSTVCRIAPARGGTVGNVGAVPPTLAESMTFDTFDARGNRASQQQRASLRDALAAARSFAKRPDGWLLMTGPTGVGKTHLAVAIAGARAGHEEAATFAFVPDLLDHLRAAYAPGSPVSYDRLFESIRNAELLILDDMPARGTTAWVDEKLYQLIVHRSNLRLPTVITTRVRTSSVPAPDDGDDYEASGGARAGRRAGRARDEERFPEEIESRLCDALIVAERFMSAPDYRIRGSAVPEPRHPRSRRSR